MTKLAAPAEQSRTVPDRSSASRSNIATYSSKERDEMSTPGTLSGSDPGQILMARRHERDSVAVVTNPAYTTTVSAAARAVSVTKVYGEGGTRVVALDDVTVDLDRGRFTAIMGPSGSGKSTLM